MGESSNYWADDGHTSSFVPAPRRPLSTASPLQCAIRRAGKRRLRWLCVARSTLDSRLGRQSRPLESHRRQQSVDTTPGAGLQRFGLYGVLYGWPTVAIPNTYIQSRMRFPSQAGVRLTRAGWMMTNLGINENEHVCTLNDGKYHGNGWKCKSDS